MEPEIRQARAADADAIAEMIARCQRDPAFHIIYLGEEPDSILADIIDLPNWTDTAMVAEMSGRIVGSLIAEVDREMGRLWWWGPFVDHEVTGGEVRWADVADGLHRSIEALLPPELAEQEVCADERSDSVRAWSERHGLTAGIASVLLRRQPGPATADPRVRHRRASDDDAVAYLHGLAFPGTHLTPEALLRSENPCLVIADTADGDSVLGYVAFELQSDGSGYLDYLAVDPEHRGRGLGAALVETACAYLFARPVVYTHLTVREDNASARALYAKLGFVEERLARPYRMGFVLDGN